jgi:glycosyltransferase involved in cell wall biosynthesis
MKSKITHITCQHALSGIGRYGFELAKQLHESGDLQAWYKPYKKGHPDSYLHEYEWIKGYQYKSFRDLHPYLLPWFIKFGVPIQTKTAHAHWFLSGLGAIKAGFKHIVITMHDVSLLHESEQSGSYEQYYANSIQLFKKKRIPIICVSEQARKDAIYYANYPEELVFAIPNGIEHEQFFVGNNPKAEKDTFRIIYSGGLGKRKNVDLLLKAYAQIETKYDFVELVLAGAHPERTPYPKMVSDLNVKNVRFTGFIPDNQMADFYRNGDLFIYPSLYEGFGFAPLEAMACGTPVLSAKGGSLSEISGGGAELFEYEVEDLVFKIETLISNAEKRFQLRVKGLNWVKQYSWNKTAHLTKELYSKVF